MKNLFKNKKFLFFLLGLFIGIFVFFPWNQFKKLLASELSQITGADISIGRLAGSTGFMAGFSRGSLFGISGNYVSIRHPIGVTIECEKLYLAPKMIPFLWGSLQVGLKCLLKDQSMLAGLIKIHPFWSLTSGEAQADVYIETQDFSLNPLSGISGLEGINGRLSGEIELKELPLNLGSLPRSSQWDIKIKGLQTPALDLALAPLPSMTFSEGILKGTLTHSALNLDTFSLGSAANPLETNFKLSSVQLDGNFNPRNGTFSGSIRIDPEFEKQHLTKISWNSAFGLADANGKRVFKRSAKGQWHTFLLFGPPD